jgi:hypothetical protein
MGPATSTSTKGSTAASDSPTSKSGSKSLASDIARNRFWWMSDFIVYILP